MLDIILKHAFEILQTTDDNREKLQAMGTQGYSFGKSELLSNATTIDSALSYIRSNWQEQQKRGTCRQIQLVTTTAIAITIANHLQHVVNKQCSRICLVVIHMTFCVFNSVCVHIVSKIET